MYPSLDAARADRPIARSRRAGRHHRGRGRAAPARCRSCSSSTRTRWATARARCRTTSAIMAAHDRLCGGFVWEWIDHGFTATRRRGRPFVMHGDDVDVRAAAAAGSACTGCVFSDRTPTPGLAELAQGVRAGRDRGRRRRRGIGTTYDTSADTSDLAFRWSARGRRRRRRARGAGCAAARGGRRQRRPCRCPPTRASDRAGDVVLTVEAALAAGRGVGAGRATWSRGAAGRSPSRPRRSRSRRDAVGRRQRVAEPAGDDASTARRASATVGAGDRSTRRSGRLVRLGDLELDGPWLDLHRAPTENDHGQGDAERHRRRCGARPAWTGCCTAPTPVELDGVAPARARAHRADDASARGRRGRCAGRPTATASCSRSTVDFVGPWADTPYLHRDIWVPAARAALRACPVATTDVDLVRPRAGRDVRRLLRGLARRAVRARRSTTLQVRLPGAAGERQPRRRPAGSRLAAGDVPTLRVEGRPSSTSPPAAGRRTTCERARKPHELVDSGRVWLNIDHRQQGLGSASVGPALPERYRSAARADAWQVRSPWPEACGGARGRLGSRAPEPRSGLALGISVVKRVESPIV